MVLRILGQGGIAYEPALRQFAIEFEEMTGARVEYDGQPWEQLMPKLQADLASGKPQYDMFAGDIEFQYPVYPSLLPLNDLIEKYDYDMEGFAEPVYNYGEGVSGGLEGVRFGLPIRIGASWVFYRTDLIDEFPDTWEDYDAMLAELTTDGKYGLAFAGVNVQLVKLFLARYWSQGDPLMTADWEPLINSEKGVKALTMLKNDLNHAPPCILGWDNPDASAAFLNGDVAVLEGWASFIAPDLQDPEKSQVVDKWAVAKYPENGTGNFTQHNMDIFNTTENPDAAFEFIAYATGPENAKRLLMEYEEESPRVSIWSDEDVLAEKPFLPDVAKAYAVGKPFTPGLPQWLEMFVALAEGLSSGMADQMTPQEALDGVAERWSDLIEQARPDWEYQE
ncbi:MAG: extracellular solute-binding protein [Chloroflexi bacterium]|nr:extracellular solute-binding protein [Chloroflexota bacterium]